MKLQLLTDTGSLIREWPMDSFGDLNDPQNARDLVAAVQVNLHRARQSERLPDLVPPGPVYRMVPDEPEPFPYPETCAACASRKGPPHNGTPYCRSGSIASGGTKAHCSCDEACW